MVYAASILETRFRVTYVSDLLEIVAALDKKVRVVA